jgi:ABC-type nitrate/sulfonate/bicarbonate transport system substrate-binding protein
MECYRTAIGPKRQRFYGLITILFVLSSSSGTKAADNIIMGMAGLNFSFLPFQIAMEKRFYEKYDLSVKPVLMRAQV